MEGIIRQANETHLVVACNLANASCLTPGCQVMLEQKHKGGYYQFQTTILQTRENCFVAPLMPAQLVQRRRCPRIACHLTGRFRNILQKEGHYFLLMGEQMTLEIVDISLGGARAYLDTQMEANSKHEIQISLNETEEICALIKILRCTELSAKEKHLHPERTCVVAIQFLEMSRVHQVQLQRLLMKFASRAG